jgi:hypothetical protein
MELCESVSTAVFSEESNVCPMEPHSKKGFIFEKKIGEKSVAELRIAMEEGISTRGWKQQGDDFTAAENKDCGMQSAPEIPSMPIKIAGEEYPLSVAAHHLIPGEASLPNSNVTRYLWASEGVIRSDVGYSVDGSENGVWLPTHQVMSTALGKAQTIIIHDEEDPARTTGMSWAELSDRAKEHEQDAATYTQLFLPRYTQQAMRALGAQFHDAHSNYNTRVTDLLNKIDALIQIKSMGCEQCKNETKKSPPYMIVYRLNAISNLLRGILTGYPKRVWISWYTSEFACMYCRNPLPDDKLGI